MPTDSERTWAPAGGSATTKSSIMPNGCEARMLSLTSS